MEQFQCLCQYYVGELVTCLKRSSLVKGGREAVIYVTVTGKIGALFPLMTKDDIEFFTALQMELRSKASKPLGRDFAKWRSMFAPMKKVVDGDLISLWNSLDLETQKEIAEGQGRTVVEIGKKIDQVTVGLL